MSRKCGSCNAVIEDGMRVCPNCGRLLADIGERHEYQPERKTLHTGHQQTHTSPRSAHPGEHTQPEHRAAKPAHTTARQTKKEEKSELPRWLGAAKKAAVTALVLTAVYFALFGLQVLRIRHSTYDFQTEMKLGASNYGEAFDNSVTDGSWSYNPFTFSATYSGTHDGEEIKVNFSALLKVDVKSVEVGGEVKDTKKQINIYLMGLFI